ncbi:hypothetical protein FB567DRAFT_558778 [Paraphoma chrysanthemicola]|uniref:Uncharacterized protein n=1 Tax=Paraphoma chrysanthemicola TaxID=798071 RepID=A0A8K0RDE7_9PLEO|nr:hypothetical protein FB567DRAFT_558778 [Paraphoma chrysanthemicola]
MSIFCAKPDNRVGLYSLCRTFCLYTMLLQAAYAQPRAGGLVLSQVIPSGPIPSQTPSTTSEASVLPPPPLVIPSAPVPTEPFSIPPIPTAPFSSGPRPFPSVIPSLDASVTVSLSRPGLSAPPGMTSTDEGLKPIPPAATQTGDPNGHHEITEPNFSSTKPCRGCSPAVEITATGWIDSPEEVHETSSEPINTRVSAGPSNILISQALSGGNFVIGGSTTITAGQTITVDGTPIAIQTSAGRVDVVVGSSVLPLEPDVVDPGKGPRVTHAPTPLPPVLTIGSETIVANSQTEYIVSGQTLSPGGAAITVAGSTISLTPSATAVVVNGVTSTVVPNFGNIWTTAAPALTFNNHVYTANRAGYITIGPGTVLKPGGDAVTVDGTTLSLDHSGTAVVVQGSTSILEPVTTVVTLTKSMGGAGGNGYAGYSSGGTWVLPTAKNAPEIPAKPVRGAASATKFDRSDSWGVGFLLLIWWGMGYLAVGI